MLVLVPPVQGPVVEAFHYEGSPFQRGLHRGIDLHAPPGTPVKAPCTGTVAWAGANAITLICERERVTLLPLTSVVVRTAQPVRAGDRLAKVSGHENLHLGVRHAGDPFGYVDPEPLLRRPKPSVPPLVGPRPRARPAQPVRVAPPTPAPAAEPLAPWTAWAGLALALGGVRVRVRRRRAAAARVVASSPPWPSM